MTKIDGDKVLYKYLQNDLQNIDFPFFFQAAIRFVTDLGVWIHPESYRRIPILEPICVRDTSVIPTTNRAEWGKPQFDSGYFRDDNSMVNTCIKDSKYNKIESKRISAYNRMQLGKGYWCCHVWREIGTGKLANRHNELFSFAPNLVWLPKQIAKLTDREGSIVQTVLQELSYHIYKDVIVEPGLKDFIDEHSWKKIENLTRDRIIPESALPSVDSFNFVKLTDSFIRTKIRKHTRTANALLTHSKGGSLTAGKIMSSKYDPHISKIDKNGAKMLGEWVTEYINHLEKIS
jgi:hypothetical protein